MFNARQTSGYTPTRYKYFVSTFGGVDTVSAQDDIAEGRASEMSNFIRKDIGELTKRDGFEKTLIWETAQGSKQFINSYSFAGKTFLLTREEDMYDLYYESPHTPLSDVIGKSGMTFSFINCFAAGGFFFVFAVGKEADSTVSKKIIVRFESTVTAENQLTAAYWLDVDGTDILPAITAADPLLPIPTIVIGADPEGGGSTHLSPNMLTPLVRESFCVAQKNLENGKCNRFQLSLRDLRLFGENGSVITAAAWNTKNLYYTKNDSGILQLTASGAAVLCRSVKIEVLQKTGTEQYDYDWVTLKNSDIFKEGKVNIFKPDKGALWIPAANIGASPIDGEDNVRITYARNQKDFQKEMETIFFGHMQLEYGVAGYKDRLFTCCGNNKIYFSEMDNPLMIGDLNYLELGTAGTEIKVVSGVGQYLYAVDQNGMTYVISGSSTKDVSDTFMTDASFAVVDRVQGAPPAASGKTVTFGNEFVYWSREGVTAIYHDNIYDTRYAQCRSRMLDGELKKLTEEKLSRAVLLQSGDFLYIAVGKKIYILDEKQPFSSNVFKYSGKQYEAYIFDFAEGFVDEDFAAAFVSAGTVTFVDGKSKYSMCTDLLYDYDLYTGEEYAISAYWITPQISGYTFLKMKDSVRVGLRVGQAGDVVKLESKADDHPWHTVDDSPARFAVFDYSDIHYDRFAYNTDCGELLLYKDHRKLRKYNTISFKFSNDGKEDKLTVKEFGIMYIEEAV